MNHFANEDNRASMQRASGDVTSGGSSNPAGAALLDKHYKSYPPTSEPCTIAEIKGRGWNLYRDDLPYPIAVLNEAALNHNLCWMQEYARQRGVELAPHGKTTMSTQIFRSQLDAGAWGLTFATVFQVQAGVQAGARRIIIANQVLGAADLAALAAMLSAHSDLNVWFLIDSIAQVAVIESWATQHSAAVQFDCLLEIGVQGQRTGCRTREQALAVAQRIHACSNLRLGGIECYEGGLAHCDLDQDRVQVGEFMDIVRDIALAVDDAGLFDTAEIIVSAGGSAVFDLVLPALTMTLSRPVRGVLRSGCYIAHDHGFYSHMLHNVEQREGLQASLRPALEVWAMVQSVPEPGLAILSCGKRDISFDLAMPVVARYAPRQSMSAVAAPGDWRITALNDQHAYMRCDAAGRRQPEVGDRIVLGISHSCTTFDKWSWLPVVDEQGNVVSAVTTSF